MNETETILALLAVTTALVAVARKIDIPYPILLVLGGLALSFVPGLPRVELEPELIFVLVLPPILQSAAFFTPIRDFRAQIRPILSLAFGLVILTTLRGRRGRPFDRRWAWVAFGFCARRDRIAD